MASRRPCGRRHLLDRTGVVPRVGDGVTAGVAQRDRRSAKYPAAARHCALSAAAATIVGEVRSST
jgi:hypothetical protein